MRVLVTGAYGMLGTDVVDAFSSHWVRGLGSADLDIRDLGACKSAVTGSEIVINCAAYTAVDRAESEESDAMSVNGTGVSNLAIAAKEAGARFITISTDYVFNGQADTPYSEDAPRTPVSAYGRSKAVGEDLALSEHPSGTYIVRTAWLYGKNGSNFAKTMLNLASTQQTWSVVDDQIGQPTWTKDLAEQVLRLAESDAPAGVYHGTNSGQASWFEFAQAVLVEAGLDPGRITPTDSSDFVRPAPRPGYSVLSHDRWSTVGLSPMRPWREALHAAFEAGVFEAPADLRDS